MPLSSVVHDGIVRPACQVAMLSNQLHTSRTHTDMHALRVYTPHCKCLRKLHTAASDVSDSCAALCASIWTIA